MLAPIVVQQADGDRTPLTRNFALPAGAGGAALAGRDATDGATYFTGGVYYARKKPTCGGTSLGLPCVFGEKHPDSKYVIVSACRSTASFHSAFPQASFHS